MTTYTKTQLIDMAIDKLGESPDWGDYRTIVSVSGKINTVHGFGKFVLGTEEGQRGCDEIVPNAWQLVCTREQFEQRVAERKVVNKPKLEWEYCPECGSYEVSYEEGIHKQCADCSQEWFSDVDYTDVVRSHLQDNCLGKVKPTLEWWDYENDQMICNPPVGTHLGITWGSKTSWHTAVVLPNDTLAVSKYGRWGISVLDSLDNLEFRPLDYKPKLTERQQAGLKLWRAINFKGTESDEFIISQERFEDYCRPFDQGLLK